MNQDTRESRARAGHERLLAGLAVWKKLTFSLVPLLILLIAGEVAVRLTRGRLLDSGNARASRIRLEQRGFPWQHHEVLGYVPAPTAAPADPLRRIPLTIQEDGLRSNGNPDGVEGPAILAVGDSMTFGDGVADADTWPGHLERLLGRPVMNAGVFGYGLDQMTLRAEMLVPLVEPSILVVDVNPATVFRCELSCGAAPKPFFRIVDEGLELYNVPVPEPSFSGARGPKRILGYSHLADALLGRFAQNWWLVDVIATRAHDRGGEVSTLLLDRLIELCDDHDCRLVLMVHPTLMNPALCQPILQRARSRSVVMLDLGSVATDRMAAEPRLMGEWFLEDGHTSSAGNEWVARQLAPFLEGEGMLDAPSPRTAPDGDSQD